MASQKINITLPVDLLERMALYSKKNSISRSGLIALSVSQYLNALEATPALQTILSSLAAVAEGTLTGNMPKDEADLKLEDIQKAFASIQEAQKM